MPRVILYYDLLDLVKAKRATHAELATAGQTSMFGQSKMDPAGKTKVQVKSFMRRTKTGVVVVKQHDRKTKPVTAKPKSSAPKEKPISARAAAESKAKEAYMLLMKHREAAGAKKPHTTASGETWQPGDKLKYQGQTVQYRFALDGKIGVDGAGLPAFLVDESELKTKTVYEVAKPHKAVVRSSKKRVAPKAKKPSKAPPKRKPGAASEKQINYAMRLLNRVRGADWFDTDMGDTGRPKPTRHELSTWKSRDVSALIAELKDMY